MHGFTDDKFTLVQPISIPFGPYEMRISNASLIYRNSLSFDHWHDEYELHYVAKGDSIIVVDGVEYPVKEGEVCWINPKVNRYVNTSPNGEHMHFVVHFKLILRPVKDSVILMDYDDIAAFIVGISQKKVWIGEPKSRYNRLYELICDELEQKRFGHMIVVRNMLCSYITNVIQNLGVSLMSDSAYWVQPDSVVHTIISYIRNHYSENISLSSVAKALNLSERHLTRLLREKYGTTFNATLISFRISHVQEHLALGNESLESIAESTGFSSVSIMASNFKKLTGKTIKEYRRELKNSTSNS